MKIRLMQASCFYLTLKTLRFVTDLEGGGGEAMGGRDPPYPRIPSASLLSSISLRFMISRTTASHTRIQQKRFHRLVD